MNKEISAGAVIFRKEKSCPMFLLLYSGRNKTWGFPKGHIELRESERDAAIREIKEETGLADLRFVDGFRDELIYIAKSNRGSNIGAEIEKHSVYFLCETNEKNIKTDGTEITDYKWGTHIDAKKLLDFDNMKDLLDKAFTFACINIPKNAKWKKIAISHTIDRYVLDASEYRMPYYEVDHHTQISEDHTVYFVVPGDGFGLAKDIKEVIDDSNPYSVGPYHDYIKAIKEYSKKRGLPTEIES